MKPNLIVALYIIVIIASTESLSSQRGTGVQGANASFGISGNTFVKDGAPFQILSGSIHYFRSLPDQWPDRLAKAKALGLNAIQTYIPWNLHESEPGAFSFSGRLNITQFLQSAQDAGLYVLLRPGPYICAEWDFGGLP